MLKIVNVPLLPAEMSDKLSEGPGTTETGVISRTLYGKENIFFFKKSRFIINKKHIKLVYILLKARGV